MFSKMLYSATYVFISISISFFSQLGFSQDYNYGAILQYHHVNTKTPAVTSISPELFSQHLELIKKEGFSVLPLGTMIKQIKLGQALNNKSVAITFDDNYRSIYDNAFPLLKARKFPFTIFINPKTIRSNNSPSNLILSWDQLSEMKAHGATIANHSQNHWHLLKRQDNETKTDWKKRIRRDIELAQDMIISQLGETPNWIAYPYGEFDHDLKNLIKSMNYLGFSQQSGPLNSSTNWQAIPRFPASGVYANTATLKTKLYSQPFEIFSEKPISKIRSISEVAPTLELIVSKHNIRHQDLSCYFLGNKIYSEVKINGGHLIINTQHNGKLPFGRSRYNCTAPAKSGHYFWYSMPFVTTNENGEWQD